jgi:hypothetical protein
MAGEVARILEAAGLQTPAVHRDLQGIARVVTAATRPAPPGNAPAPRGTVPA